VKFPDQDKGTWIGVAQIPLDMLPPDLEGFSAALILRPDQVWILVSISALK
jgi:hypothetical protein